MDHIQFIDHHCHGIVTGVLDRNSFEALISDSFKPPAPGTNHFQKPRGLAVRRYCAPILDLEPLVSAEQYIERRMALGPDEVNRRFLRASGIDVHLLDTGHKTSDICSPETLAEISGHAVREVIRIEAVAEDVAISGCSAEQYPKRFAEALLKRSKNAIGLKSIVAYRATFKIEQTAPKLEETVKAAGEWLKKAEARAPGKRPRLDNAVLIRHGLWQAAQICREKKFPLQLHSGYGDPDVYLHACDPSHFTDFLRSMEELQVAVTLLHNYPFEREAAWLSEAFQNVYYDVSAVLNFTGPSAQRVMHDALEMGPFTKHLFATDAFGLPEYYYLGVTLFRKTLTQILDSWIKQGDCTARDADDIYHAIGRGNAARIYNLAES
jgi:uncharacterized protein